MSGRYQDRDTRLAQGGVVSVFARWIVLKEEESMAVVSKKTAKSKSGTGKSSKRASAAKLEFEIPVLFRLPDLTLLADSVPLHEIAPLQLTASPNLTSPDATLDSPTSPVNSAQPPVETAPTRAQKIPNKVWLTLKEWTIPLGKKASYVARRMSRLPYVGPGGVLAASLIVTLGLIYTPWNQNPKSSDLPVEAQGNSSTAEVVQSTPSVASASPRPEGKADLQLKKIADQLNEQLTESESTEVSIATATASSSPAENPATEDGEFTEPWWRRKPAGDHLLAKEDVETNAEHEVVVHGEADEDGATADEELADKIPDRTEMVDRRERNPRYGSAEDRYPTASQPLSNRDSRADSSKRNFDADKIEASDADSTEEQVDAEIPQNPWRRIRKERLEREAPREESIAQRPVKPRSTQSSAPKPQYRSPPGQDIDLESELPFDATANRRGEPKRNGGK